ncbi:magnesium transporter NIPA-domain-containing protein [Podospora didyma]|uniref:Magnesium transporter NIPA-domain-containing protein n=1 Tax=Podospora didyma TaxID=330526 RepID=A0AAE0N2S6_9PEZI|nr:magnesium transporter NIPA-domain-containing protein [Podospora didyma]
MMLEEKYIGLALAISSSLAIGTSFVITKKGLIQAEERHGFEGDGYIYMKNPLWWGGIACLGLGEVFNFAAYAFAPAILVTPLGALAVLVGAVLGSYFLNEELGTLGKLGSAICLIGAVIIVLHAPPDEEITRIDEILNYAIQPGFLAYAFIVCVFAGVMIYKVAPIYGRRNPLVYLSICSTVGSISVMSVKAFGMALKLTFAGNNQFGYPSTYVFMIITAVCILTQMNYFNKALSQFPTNMQARCLLYVLTVRNSVNPLYYVTFTTFTLCASFILFSGFNTTDTVTTLSLICGFLVTFTGVYLLNLSRHDPNGTSSLARRSGGDSTGTDMISSLQTRMSMEARRSQGHRMSIGSNRAGDRDGLIRAYDEEEAAGFGLTDLAEDTDEDMDPRSPMIQPNGHANGGSHLSPKPPNEAIEMQARKPGGGR